MTDATQIVPHMQVVGSDDEPVGTVDRLDGTRIKLTKADSPDGQHHFLPVTMVAAVLGDTVHLTHSASFARDNWQTDDTHSGPDAAHAGGNETGMSRDSLGQSTTDGEADKSAGMPSDSEV